MNRWLSGTLVGVLVLALVACAGGKPGAADSLGSGAWDLTAGGNRPRPAASATKVLTGYSAQPKPRWTLNTTTIFGSQNDNQVHAIFDATTAGRPGELVFVTSQLIQGTTRKNALVAVEAKTGAIKWNTPVGESTGPMRCGMLADGATACLLKQGADYTVSIFAADGKPGAKVKLPARVSSLGQPGFGVGGAGFAVSENTQELPAKLRFFGSDGQEKWTQEIVAMGIDPQFATDQVFGSDYAFSVRDGKPTTSAYLADKYQPLISSVTKGEVKLSGAAIPLAGQKLAIPGPIDALVPAILTFATDSVSAYSPDGKKQWSLAAVSAEGFGYCGQKLYFVGAGDKKLVVADVKTGKRLASAAVTFDPEQFFCTDSGNAVLNNKQNREIIGLNGGEKSWSVPMKFGFGDQLFAVANGLIHSDNRSKDQPIVQFLEG